MPAQPHTSRDFDSELRELRAHTLAMGARCERALRLALEAFWTGSREVAAEVDELDRRVDQDEMDLDALVVRMLALRQPVADDLRFLAGAMRLATDLERIGDEAVNIGERANGAPGPARNVADVDLRAMGQHAQEMLRGALEAFVNGETGRAEEVLTHDDVVDELYGRVVRAVTDYMATNAGQSADALRVIQVSKSLERIADHATNIAEQAIFVGSGEDVRHGQTRPRGKPDAP